MNVDHPGCAKPELRGQGAGHERNVIGETGLQFLAEAWDAFRQKHVVDTILQVGVLTADVKLTERILRYTGKAQDGLIEGSVFTLRLRIEPVRANRVTGRAETRHNLLA